MCLITYTPNKTLLNLDDLEVGYQTNPDGFGIVFAQDNRLHIAKRMSNYETFKAIMAVVPEEVPVGIHFRWRTHGTKDLSNVHPYEILSVEQGDTMDLVMMHNGVISGTDPLKQGHNDPRSDTLLYIDHVLKPIIVENPDIVRNAAFQLMIERDIGSGNKLLFMYGDGTSIICNKKAGHTPKEKPVLWFSNQYSFNSSHRSTKGKWTREETVDYQGWRDKDEKKAQQSTTTTTTTTDTQTTVIGSGVPGDDYSVTDLDRKSVNDNRTYWAETEITEKMKKLIDPDGTHPTAYLIKPIQRVMTWGLGWVAEGSTVVQNKALGLLHRELLRERHMKAELNKSAKDVIKPSTALTTIPTSRPNTSPVQQILELRGKTQEEQQESKADTKDFMLMSSSEIMEWVVKYPRETSKWLLTNYKFTGNVHAIEGWVQMNLDAATEAIYELSHNKKHIDLKVKDYSNNNLDNDGEIDYSLAM